VRTESQSTLCPQLLTFSPQSCPVHVTVEASGVQHALTLQIAPPVQVPHDPPQVSPPQVLPAQSGVQLGVQTAWSISMLVVESVQSE